MGKNFKAVSAGNPILVKNVKISTVKYVETVIIKETMDKVLSPPTKYDSDYKPKKIVNLRKKAIICQIIYRR